MKMVKIHSAEASLGTFITQMSSYDLILPQIKITFYSANVLLLSEISHVWSKSNRANDSKTLTKEREMKSSAQMPLVRSHSENLTSALLCEKLYNEKSVRRQNKKHSRTSPDQKFKEFPLTKQKTRYRMDYEWIGKATWKKKTRKI